MSEYLPISKANYLSKCIQNVNSIREQAAKMQIVDHYISIGNRLHI